MVCPSGSRKTDFLWDFGVYLSRNGEKREVLTLNRPLLPWHHPIWAFLLQITFSGRKLARDFQKYQRRKGIVPWFDKNHPTTSKRPTITALGKGSNGKAKSLIASASWFHQGVPQKWARKAEEGKNHLEVVQTMEGLIDYWGNCRNC